MARFVKLTSKHGDPIWVNPEHVWGIEAYDSDEPRSVLHMPPGEAVCVMGTPEKIVTALEGRRGT